MVEGEWDNYHNSINGEFYVCYWNQVALKEYVLSEENTLPVSGEDCLRCSLEKCLGCQNYCPSTKTYPKKIIKNKFNLS